MVDTHLDVGVAVVGVGVESALDRGTRMPKMRQLAKVVNVNVNENMLVVICSEVLKLLLGECCVYGVGKGEGGGGGGGNGVSVIGPSFGCYIYAVR